MSKKLIKILEFINSNKINHELYSYTIPYSQQYKFLVIENKFNHERVEISLTHLEFIPKEIFILLSRLPIQTIREIFNQHTYTINSGYRYVKLRTTLTTAWLEYRKSFWPLFFNNDILEVDIL